MTFSNPPTQLKYAKFHTFFEPIPYGKSYKDLFTINQSMKCCFLFHFKLDINNNLKFESSTKYVNNKVKMSSKYVLTVVRT